jgi:hypothetical protein
MANELNAITDEAHGIVLPPVPSAADWARGVIAANKETK